MKKFLSIAAQFFLFLLVFLGGTLADPFHLKWSVTHPTPTSTRYFVPDGLILMVALYLLFLVVEFLMKKLTRMGLWTTAAFLLALVLGFLSKFGFATHDLY